MLYKINIRFLRNRFHELGFVESIRRRCYRGDRAKHKSIFYHFLFVYVGALNYNTFNGHYEKYIHHASQ